MGFLIDDSIGVGDALVTGLDGVVDVLAVLSLDQVEQLVRIFTDDDRPETKTKGKKLKLTVWQIFQVQRKRLFLFPYIFANIYFSSW